MEKVKFFEADGSERIVPLEDVMAVSPPEDKLRPIVAVSVILGSILIVCGTLVACVWIVMSQLNM